MTIKFNSEEYVDTVFEQAYSYHVKTRPDAAPVTHYHFAEQCAQIEKLKEEFYEDVSKYAPHQGNKERERRLKLVK